MKGTYKTAKVLCDVSIGDSPRVSWQHQCNATENAVVRKEDASDVQGLKPETWDAAVLRR